MGTSRWLNITKEQLIQNLKNKANELGRTPNSTELKHPGSAVYYDRFNTTSWNDILKIAELNVNHEEYTDEFLLKRLKDFCDFLGRNPKRDDFKKYNWIPSTRCYNTRLGGLINSLYLLGKIDKPLNKDERFQNSIICLNELAENLNRVPTVNEYDENYKKYRAMDRRSMGRKTNLSYNEICVKYLPNYDLNHESKVLSMEELINNYENCIKKLGRIPTQSEMNNNSISLYSLRRYYSVFKTKSYYDIIKELGYEPYFNKQIVKTDDELLDDFYKLFNNLQRVPYSYELDESSITCGYSVYIKRFASLQNICDLLGIDYYSYYRKTGSGIVCKDINGYICKSIPEMDIANFFINNNVLIDKENYYNELINTSKRHRFDWKVKIDDKVYYVEYLGIYNNSKFRGGLDKKYTKRAKKKIKALYKQEKIDQCIFIFKGDYDNKRIKEKFENMFNIEFKEIEYSDRNLYGRYNQISDKDLLNMVMAYSDEKIMLPKVIDLIKNNNALYTEIKHRYGSYDNFAIKNNKIPFASKNKNEKMTRIFTYIKDNYESIGSLNDLRNIVKNDIYLRGFHTIIREIKLLNFKIEYGLYCIKNNYKMSNIDLEWLENVTSNGRIKGVTGENIIQIDYILNNIINKLEYNNYKIEKFRKEESEFCNTIYKMFNYMKKTYGKILSLEEYIKNTKDDNNLKFISLPNYLRKNNKYMVDARLSYYKYIILNNETLEKEDVDYLKNTILKDKRKLGKKINDTHKEIAQEIFNLVS